MMNEKPLIFYGFARSSAAYRVRIALNLKGVKIDEYHSLTLLNNDHQRPDYRKINPQTFVPAIIQGDFVITQSLAIIEWLDETQPGMKLLPNDANLRARIRAFAQIIACDIHPLQNLRVLRYLEHEFAQDQNGKDRWCQRWLGDGLKSCEELLEKYGEHGDFCFGASPTLADICLIPQIFAAHRFHVDLSAMPRLVEIANHCQQLPQFINAKPENQPDFHH